MKSTIKTGFAAILLAISCTKENKPIPSSTVALSEDNSVTAYYIGQHYGGGIIFYIDPAGQHGLVADTTDLGKFTWWNGSFIRTGAKDTAIGTGKANTRKIVLAQGTTGSYAALECAKSKRGGYNDWFLPSKDELYEMAKQQQIVRGFQKYYFSSSEKGANWAWYQCFNTGEEEGTTKSKPRFVRAIRAF
jgi:hypothetical protein